METTGKRVLLVEDDRFLRRACEASLRQRGLTVTTAADGEEGLRLAAVHRPAALLVDGQLPGMDGPTVIRRIRLDQAHRQLQAADPHRDSVTAVAYRWGFSSPSRFATYYRRVYGVQPSHTLRS